MANDNETTGTNKPVATRKVTYSGDADQNVQIIGIGVFSGSDDAKTITDMPGGAGAVTGGSPRIAVGSDDPVSLALQIMDDWDESDRAKVNIIVGQAGVAAGSGTVSAATQRVVLATDVALPAGTNAIGKLAANSGVDIGDVDVLSVTPGTGGSHLGKTEGAAHATGYTGVMMLGVRRDANTAFTGVIDGDYAPPQFDANGSLKVTITSGAGSGGASATDDAVFTVGTGAGTPIMGLADETSPDSVDEGDVGVFRMTLSRALHVNLRDSSGNELSAPSASSQMHKAYNTTSQQTGTDVITPSAGKKLAITSVIIASYGTTAGRVILWFGDNADTTYTAGTDQVLVAASFAPSTTSKPGLVFTPSDPVFCNTADRELHITSDAAVSLDITIEYYEI